MNKQSSILSATALLIFLVAITKLVGLWKVHLMARFIGTTRELDIFWAASTIPDMLYNIFIIGALNSALIPILSDRLVKKGEKSMWELFNNVFNFLVLGFVIFGILAFIFADPIALLMIKAADTSKTVPFTTAEVAEMAMIMRMLMVSPILLGISTLHESILNVYDRFVVPTLGPLFYNFVIIIALFVFVRGQLSLSLWDFHFSINLGGLDLGIYGLVIGVILGSLVQILIQLPLLKHLKIPYIPKIDLKSKDLWKVMTLSLPRVIGIAGDQIAVAVDRIIGLGLAIGSNSAFNFALMLYTVPIHLFGSTIGRTANPALAREYAAGNMEGFKRTLIDSMQLAFFFSIPVTVIIIVLRVPLVRMVLGAGEFDWQATLTTAWILAFLGIGILPQIVITIANRAFYSMHNTILPVVVSMVENLVNIVLAILFVNYFSHYKTVEFFYLANKGVPIQEHISRLFVGAGGPFAVGGLGLSMSVAILLWSIVITFLLNRKVHFIERVEFWGGLLSKLAIGTVSGVVMFFLLKYLDSLGLPAFDSTKVLGVAAILVVCSSVGTLVYVALCYIFKVKEMSSMMDMFKTAYAKLIA